jgi:hypothetical protein
MARTELKPPASDILRKGLKVRFRDFEIEGDGFLAALAVIMASLAVISIAGLILILKFT